MPSVRFFTLFFPFAVAASSSQYGNLNFAFPANASMPAPFKIDVDPEFVNQTVQKVKSYRLSIDMNDVSEWDDGPASQDMQQLAEYWADDYDWSTAQDLINSNFSHYTTTVQGSRNYTSPIPLHFIHERASSNDSSTIPLLLLHGWPSTNLMWSKVIKPLARPDISNSNTTSSTPSFHVVAPDLPGFGFSPAPITPGLGPKEMGDAFNALMHQLGYTRYAIASTDMGWVVAMFMVEDLPSPSPIIAQYTDFFMPHPSDSDLSRFKKNETSAEETNWIASLTAYQSMDYGYAIQQSTRPLALAQALSDSPVGWAGWIWQVFAMASGYYNDKMDDLITTAMSLFVQGTYANVRAYKEFMKPGLLSFAKTSIPTGVSQWVYPQNPYPELRAFPLPPCKWIERSSNVTFFRRHDSGGHFPALSVPELWLDDVRTFFSSFTTGLEPSNSTMTSEA